MYNHEFNCPGVGFFESGVADKENTILCAKFLPFYCKEFFVSSIRQAASLTQRTELKITRIEC